MAADIMVAVGIMVVGASNTMDSGACGVNATCAVSIPGKIESALLDDSGLSILPDLGYTAL